MSTMFNHRLYSDQRMPFSYPPYGFDHPYYHGSNSRGVVNNNIRNRRSQESVGDNRSLGFNVRIEDEVAIVDAVGRRPRLETTVLHDDDGRRQRADNLNEGFSVVDGIALLDELLRINGGSGENRVTQDKKFSAESIWQHLSCRIYQTSGDLDSGFCVVCQSEFLEAEKLGKLDCGHEFHADCIHQWLLQKNACPICKRTALAELER